MTEMHDPVERLNAHHATELLAVARAFTEHVDAGDARATGIDDEGVTLLVTTPDGEAPVRIAYAEATPDLDRGTSMRMAFRELARRSQLETR